MQNTNTDVATQGPHHPQQRYIDFFAGATVASTLIAVAALCWSRAHNNSVLLQMSALCLIVAYASFGIATFFFCHQRRPANLPQSTATATATATRVELV